MEGITFGMADQILILTGFGSGDSGEGVAPAEDRAAFLAANFRPIITNAETYMSRRLPIAAALGAAILAGVGVKVWSDVPQGLRSGRSCHQQMFRPQEDG